MATKEQYLAKHSKLLQELRSKVDDIELTEENIKTIMESPEEYAEDFAERMIVQFIPEMIKSRIEGEKLARQLIDRED